jgi:hypothetical protein
MGATRRAGRALAVIVYLVGTAGHPNYGDELITSTWLRFYAKRLPRAQVWLDTPRPGQTAVLHHGLHPHLTCVDTLYHACWNAASESVDDAVAIGREVVANPGRLPREVSGLEVLQQADLVHVLGGGYINALWPRHIALLAAAVATAERRGTRLALTGAGLTPAAAGGPAVLSDLLSRFDVVDVRDVPSLELLAGNDAVTCSGDDALLGLGSLRRRREPLARTLLCLQEDLLEVSVDDLAAYVLASLTAWGVDQEPVTLVECLPPNDLHIAPLLADGLPTLQVLPFDRLWREGFPSHPSHRWISTRFHPHLVAAATGAWGVALETGSPYYETKHASLLALGTRWARAHPSDPPVPLPRSDPAPFAGQLPSLTHHKRAVAESVAALVRSPRWARLRRGVATAPGSAAARPAPPTGAAPG